MSGKGTEKLDNESGGHRIQRVPRTERKGRVQSSTVTVAVIDGTTAPPDDFGKVSDKDFSVSWFSGSGSGGQHRNKTQNSARVTHVPTGITRAAQTRSRENSYMAARSAVEAELARQGAVAGNRAVNGLRKEQVGTGERSDKRRTFRFQEGMVHDHLTGKSAPSAKVMAGRVDLLW